MFRLVRFFRSCFTRSPTPCRLQDDILRDIGIARVTAEFP
jgi:hypothetical protein